MIENNKKAYQLIDQGRLKEAFNIYQKVLSQKNVNKESRFSALKNGGFLLYDLKRFDEAENYLKQALELPFEDENGRIHRILGFIGLIRRDVTMAAEYLKEALKLKKEKDDEYYICLYQYGKSLFEEKKREEAFECLDTASDYFRPKHYEYYASASYYLGLIRFIEREVEVASGYFEQIIAHKHLTEKQKIHGYFGMMFIYNSYKNGDKLIEMASHILEADINFHDRETLTFFMLRAYQYQNRELEYEHLLDLFIKDYPNGRYKDQYEELEKYEFKKFVE